MAATDSHRIDAPQEQPHKGDAPTQNIDRVELLKSDRPDTARPTGTAQDAGIGLKGSKAEGVLDFGQNDPFAKPGQGRGLETEAGSDHTRAVKPGKKHPGEEVAPRAGVERPAGAETPSAPEKPAAADHGRKPGALEKPGAAEKPGAPEKPGAAEKPGAPEKPGATEKSGTDKTGSPEKPKEPVTILSDTSNLDPKKPTVLFLDDFKKDAAGLFQDPRDKSLVITQGSEIALNKVTTKENEGLRKETETGFTHGEFSARMAESNGYNAIRAQQTIEKGPGIIDFSKSLNSIADQIDSGKLKMGKGDVVNVSMGELDPSFDQVNKLLKSTPENTITPQNINNPDTQKQILDRLGKNVDDPSQPQVLRDWSKILLDTNTAIQRLQGQGVEVIHSAANKGKDTVSLDFLSANKELVSADPKTGKVDNFAPEHDRATAGNGVYPIRFQPGHEQGGGREGKYTVDGTGIKFSGEEFGNLNSQQAVSFSGKSFKDEGVKSIYGKEIGREAPPRMTDDGYLVAVAAGNSFVNIDYLAKNRERLTALKRGDN